MTGRAVASQRWRDPAWLTEAVGWATDQLDRRHHRVVAPPEQTHVRPWSTVSRIATRDGTFWFKANAIGTAHEARLLDALARLAPAHVLHPLATDFERGWLLLPDGGTTLRLGRPDGMSPEQRERMRAAADRYAALCAGRGRSPSPGRGRP